MATPTLSYHSGIRVPPWATGALLAATAVFGLGVGYGTASASSSNRIEKLEEQNRGLDFRLCRIEKALNIPPYQSCYPAAADTDPARTP